jgi:AcrR family transcriptional regulator
MKNKILECAKNIYLNEGYNNLTLRKVAKCVGISATAIYRYFDNKDDLILAILSEGFLLLQRLTMSAINSASTSKERLIFAFKGFMDFALKYPALYELMFMSKVQIGEIMRANDEKYQKIRGSFFIVVDRVRECMDEGIIEKSDPVTYAFKLFALSHGTISLYITDRIRMDQIAFENSYLQALLDFIEK